MAGKKKGPGKGRGPATRPPSPAKRTTIPKSAAGNTPASAKPGAGAPKAPAKPGAAGPTVAARPAAAAAASATGMVPSARGQTTATVPGAATPGATAEATATATGKSGGPARAGGEAKPAATGKSGGPAKAGGAVKSAGATRSDASAKGGGGKAAAPSAPGKQAPGGRPRGNPSREERLAAAESARRRRRIRNKALVAAVVAATIFVIGFVVTSDRKAREQEAARFQTGSCQFDRKSDPDDGPGRNHTPTPTFTLNPPAGGNHTPQAAPAGIYTDANTPSDGTVVHAMEHGYVVLWYRPDLDEAGLTTLRDLAEKHARDVLMVPRPSLPTPVAATAWHARASCGGVEAATLERFITTFVNKGPEKVAH